MITCDLSSIFTCFFYVRGFHGPKCLFIMSLTFYLCLQTFCQFLRAFSIFIPIFVLFTFIVSFCTQFFVMRLVNCNVNFFHSHLLISQRGVCITLMNVNKIKNMLKRRKESDTYLATDCRHRRSPQITMKVDKVCSFQPALRPSSAEEKD